MLLSLCWSSFWNPTLPCIGPIVLWHCAEFKRLCSAEGCSVNGSQWEELRQLESRPLRSTALVSSSAVSKRPHNPTNRKALCEWSGRFNSLKAQRSFFPGRDTQETNAKQRRDICKCFSGTEKKDLNRGLQVVGCFCFIKCEITCLSPSSSRVSAYIQNRHCSYHHILYQQINTFVYIYSQTERTVDGGWYLFIKRWVETDSHLECEVTAA